MGVDGLQASDYPVHVGQGRPGAIASDDSIVPLSYGQVDVAHTDLRKVWEGAQGGRKDRQTLTTKAPPMGWTRHFLFCVITTPRLLPEFSEGTQVPEASHTTSPGDSRTQNLGPCLRAFLQGTDLEVGGRSCSGMQL